MSDELVARHAHPMKIRQAVVALDVLADEFDFAVGLVLVVVQVTERDLEDAALEARPEAIFVPCVPSRASCRSSSRKTWTAP